MSQDLMVICGILLFSRKKIDLRVQNSVKSICIHRPLLAELGFLKKRLPSWKTVFVKKRTGEGHLISGYGFPRKNPFLRKLKIC